MIALIFLCDFLATDVILKSCSLIVTDSLCKESKICYISMILDKHACESLSRLHIERKI